MEIKEENNLRKIVVAAVLLIFYVMLVTGPSRYTEPQTLNSTGKITIYDEHDVVYEYHGKIVIDKEDEELHIVVDTNSNIQ